MKKRILCYGDSNTWGYIPGTGERYDENTRWTGRLAQMGDYTILEEGLSGRTTVFPDPLVPCRNGADYIEACVLSHIPFDLLIVMLGTNDLKTYLANSADVVAYGVARLVRMAQAVAQKPFEVLLVAPAEICPVELTECPIEPQLNNQHSVDQSKLFGKLYRAQAELHGWHFLDAASVVKSGTGDGLHFDPEGHAALAKAIDQKIREIFA